MSKTTPIVLLLGMVACSAEPANGPDYETQDVPDTGELTEGDTGDSAGDPESSEDAGDDEGGDDDGSPPSFDLAMPDAPPSLPPCTAVDLLFVIDDSGSMSDEQNNLVDSFPGFIEGVEQLLGTHDLHLGVVTTDAYVPNQAGCRDLGALVTHTGGDLSSDAECGPYAEGERFMTDADDIAASFACAAKVGVDGLGKERPMEALELALAEPMVNGPCNDGFLRDDALLVLVVITDEEDEDDSPGGPAQWTQSVLDAKNGDPERIVVVSLLGHPKPNDCPPIQWTGMMGAEISPRLIEWTDSFPHSLVGDVCSDDYAPTFQDAIATISEVCTAAGPTH